MVESDAKVYTCDISNGKLSVNGGEYTTSDITNGNKGLVLFPGDRLEWTSTDSVGNVVNPPCWHEGGWPQAYTISKGLWIQKADESDETALEDICDVDTIEVSYVTGGITIPGNTLENSPESMEYKTVTVDNCMTAKVPMLVKVINSQEKYYYQTRTNCMYHTTSPWHTFRYILGRKVTVEPLMDFSADVEIVLEEDAYCTEEYPASLEFGKDAFTITLPEPVRSGYKFSGWKVVDANDDERTFRSLLTVNDDNSISYAGLSNENWGYVQTAVNSKICFKPKWTSVGTVYNNALDGNNGIIIENGNSSKGYLSVETWLSSSYSIGYSAILPGYTFLGWYLDEYRIDKITDIPSNLWNIEGGYKLQARWEKNGEKECYSVDLATKKLSIMDDTFFENINAVFTGWQKDILDVEILKAVTAIPSRAFYEYNAATSIEIPNTVTTIGFQAFLGCENLKSIFIPNSVKEIGTNAFRAETTVLCYSGSYAEQYAIENGIPYEIQEEHVHKYSYEYIPADANQKTNGLRTKICLGCDETFGTLEIKYPKTVTLSDKQFTYDGKTKTPMITVTDSSGKVIDPKHYTVSMPEERSAVGKYTCTIQFKGNYYTGTKTAVFTIIPKTTGITSVQNATSGVLIKWNPNSQASGYKIYRSEDGVSFKAIKTIRDNITLSYTDTGANENGKKYVYKIYAYNDATGTTITSPASSLKAVYRISRPAFTTVTPGTGKIALRWDKIAKTSGYEIQYATDSAFKTGKNSIVLESGSAYGKTITGLVSGKKYYIRIRAYREVSGRIYYSTWSSTKYATVK